MKKLLLMSFTLVLIIGSTAIAWSGTGRWESDPVQPNYVKYADLDDAYKDTDGYGPDTGDPHGGYATTTNLCSFCHAVHNAGIDGNGGGAYKLTRSSNGQVLGACYYCHESGGLVTKQPYSTASFDSEPVRAEHRLGIATEVPDSTIPTTVSIGLDSKLDCVDCHNAAPHGAGETADSKLFKDAVAVGNVTPVCVRCHNKNFVEIFNGASHVMTVSPDGGLAYRGVTVVGGGVSSTRCVSCHSNLGKGMFPHISSAARFLKTAAGDLNASGSSGSLDAVCMECHGFWPGAVVGVDF